MVSRLEMLSLINFYNSLIWIETSKFISHLSVTT